MHILYKLTCSEGLDQRLHRSVGVWLDLKIQTGLLGTQSGVIRWRSVVCGGAALWWRHCRVCCVDVQDRRTFFVELEPNVCFVCI